MLRYNATENRLRNTITYEMIASRLQKSCKAWVADDHEVVVGFSLANKKQKSLWGLFVLSSCQEKGVGKQLLQHAVSWLTEEARDYLIFKPKKIWLDTELGGRAETFYQHMGWEKGELRPDGEVRYWYRL
jgi:GNAT superfamily N-acetyltransferase